MKPITEKENELKEVIIPWCRKRGLGSEEALAIGLCCRGDQASQEMIDFLHANPEINYNDLLLKAVEIGDKYGRK